AGLAHHHVDSLLQAEERGFVGVDGDADDQLVDQLHRAANDIEMAVGDGIERARIEADTLQVASAATTGQRSTYRPGLTRRPSFRTPRHRPGPPALRLRRRARPPPPSIREHLVSPVPQCGSDPRRNVSIAPHLSPP